VGRSKGVLVVRIGMSFSQHADATWMGTLMKVQSIIRDISLPNILRYYPLPHRATRGSSFMVCETQSI
jgi:hypothetical protein